MVYPRAYGGTALHQPTPEGTLGLSPRLRGNPPDLSLMPVIAGSIPAPTGEPCPAARRTRVCRVYPRAYGGTISNTCARTAAPGLSPRLRGNQRELNRGRLVDGSIPAPTGEPSAWMRS